MAKYPEVVVVEILQNNQWSPYYSEIDHEGSGEVKKRLNAFATEAIKKGIASMDSIRVSSSPFGALRISAAQKKEFYGEGEGED